MRKKNKSITIEVRGGCVYVTRQSPGTTLTVRDFDIQEEERGDKRDKDGDPYRERKYVEREKP